MEEDSEPEMEEWGPRAHQRQDDALQESPAHVLGFEALTSQGS